MNRVLLRNVCVDARTRLLYNPSPQSQIATLAVLTRPKLSFYSTGLPTPRNDVSFDADDAPSNEEVMKQIEDFYSGNEEALPSIFESIMKRQLTGKHEEADKMLMEAITAGSPSLPSDIDDKDDSDDEDWSESGCSESDCELFTGSEGETDDEEDSSTKEKKTLEATDINVQLRKSSYEQVFYDLVSYYSVLYDLIY